MNNEVEDSLLALKMVGAYDQYAFQQKNIVNYYSASFEDRLLEILKSQIDYKNNREAEILINRSNVKRIVHIDNININKDRGLDIGVISCIKDLTIVKNNFNMVIEGKTGSGKTELASAIINHCCRNLISCFYIRESELLLTYKAKSDGAKKRYLNRLFKYQVLVLDDFAITNNHDNKDIDLFYEILEQRNFNKTTIICTQLKQEGVRKVFKDTANGQALIRRIYENAVNINLKYYEQLKLEKEVKEDNMK